MLHRYALTALLGLACLLTAKAQPQKGFKLLKARKYEAAANAFEKQTSNPVKQVASAYGQVAVAVNQSKDLSSLVAQKNALIRADSLFATLDPKQQAKVRKQGLKPRLESRTRLAVVSKSIRALELAPTLDNVKLFQDAWPRASWTSLTTKNQDRIDRARVTAVTEALKGILDYVELSYIVKQQQDAIREQSLRFADGLDSRLLSAFVSENGWENLDEFAEDHPEHWMASDCWLEEFVAAAKDGSVDALLNFVEARPYSMAENQARILVGGKVQQTRGQADDSPMAPLYERHLAWRKFRNVIYEDSIPEGYLGELLAWLEEEAPRRSAYFVLERSLQAMLDEKRWDEAQVLMRKAQAWFPDVQPEGCKTYYTFYKKKEAWFKGVLAILDLPVEGIIQRPIEELNTRREELSPVATADGKRLYFARTNLLGTSSGEDIALSTKVEGKWSEPELVHTLSSGGNEAPLALTADGRSMLLFKDGRLFMSHYRRGNWQRPDTLAGDWNGLQWIGKATLSSDGSILILEGSRERWETSTASNTDLYICKLGKKGVWSKPVRLPRPINTSQRERSPFLHTDGRTLYFSSDGRQGLGGMDMYRTTRIGEGWSNWSEPVNLGKELNTVRDDWGLMMQIAPNGQTSYYSSFVQGGDKNNLFMTLLPERIRAEKRVIVTGALQDDTGKNLRGTIEFVDSTGQVVARIRTDEMGNYTVPMIPGMQLTARAAGKNLFPITQPVMVPDVDSIDVVEVAVETVPLKKLLVEDQAAPLNSLTFAYNDSALQSSSYAELNHFLNFLGKRRGALEVIGHTDDTGNPDHNYTLSLGRAHAVRDYLVAQGYPAERITCTGKGETEPVAENDTDEGRAANRRVEVKLGGKKQQGESEE